MCKKKSIAKTILLAITLLICASQQAMEDKKSKKLPELELIEKKEIPGYICNPKEENSDYFLVYRENEEQQTSTLEIWDKRLSEKINEVSSTQVLEILLSHSTHSVYRDIINKDIHYFMKKHSVIIETSKIIIYSNYEPYTYPHKFAAAQYDLATKTWESIYIDEEKTKGYKGNPYHLFAIHKTYIVKSGLHSGFYIHHDEETKPIGVNLPQDYYWKNMFCGNHHILVHLRHEANFDDPEFVYLYSTKTGKPITHEGKNLNIKTFIPNWSHNIDSIKHACFNKNDSFIVLLCTQNNQMRTNPREQIIFFDVKKVRFVGQYTFAKNFEEAAIHLSSDEQEIVVVSNENNLLYRFKNPLIARDTDEPERLEYVLHNQTCPRANNEQEKFVINVNGIQGAKIPVDRSLLL